VKKTVIVTGIPRRITGTYAFLMGMPIKTVINTEGKQEEAVLEMLKTIKKKRESNRWNGF